VPQPGYYADWQCILLVDNVFLMDQELVLNLNDGFGAGYLTWCKTMDHSAVSLFDKGGR